MNARLVAWHLLRETRAGALGRASVARAAKQAELAPLDRATLAAILGAEARRRAGLRAIAEHLGERRHRPDVAAFAHIGLAQLLFLERVPDHAAIGETVEAARTQLGEKPSSAVNGFLRRVQREIRRGTSGDPRRDVPFADVHFDSAVFADPAAHWLLWAEQALSLPVPIGRRWRNRYGDAEAERLARAAILAPDVSLHVAGDLASVRAELAGIDLRPSAHPRVFLAPASARATIRASAAHARGDFALLGETSVRAVDLLAARAGERVLEPRAHRREPHPILAASGAHVEIRLPAQSVLADEEPFDAAFVAPPSSGTGVLATKPGLRWSFDAARSSEIAAQQTTSLATAASAVRSGGRLVYATRSIEPDENQRRVRAFLDAHPHWSLAAEITAVPADPGSDGPVDGGYAALLTRG